MASWPILSGVYTDAGPDFRTSYPVNMVPVPKSTGVNQLYLRPGDGLAEFTTGPAIGRGAINWNGVCYAVMGPKLVSIDSTGVALELGHVGNDGTPVTFDYSFDRLGVASAGGLFYWDGSTLTRVTDADLGTVVDLIWIDGYFMTTDGESLVVTDLNAPTAVNPLKYGSSEADPDPVNALLKLRNEAVALNRHTIEFFDNIGGNLFPFQRIEGAQIEKGVIGTHACCIFAEAIAFLGGGFNEEPSIYLGLNGGANKIATQEIDTILRGYTEAELVDAILEARNDRSHLLLYVHLPDRTLVYDAMATEAIGEPVWYVLTSAIEGFEQYRARHFTWVYNKWLVIDPQAARIGYVTDTVSTHYGSDVRWEFGTVALYNEARGVLVHELELVTLTGSVALGANPVISTSYTFDGQAWSEDRTITVGTAGHRGKRLVWYRQGHLRQWRAQRFRGTSAAHIAPIRLEARLEPLAW